MIDCPQGRCRMWEVQQQIDLLHKQLRHEMRRNAGYRARLKVADKLVKALEAVVKQMAEEEKHEPIGEG